MKPVYISSYLWEALESMSKDTGSNGVSICNQALYSWLNQAGYAVKVPLGTVIRDASQENQNAGPPTPRATPPEQRRTEEARAHATPQRPNIPADDGFPWPTIGQAAAEARSDFQSGPVGGGRPTLLVKRESDAPLKVNGDRFLIGRGPQCDMVIASPRVSREHAVITFEDDRFVLRDLGSSNGTWMNGERIERRDIFNGDTIVLGNETLTFVIKES